MPKQYAHPLHTLQLQACDKITNASAPIKSAIFYVNLEACLATLMEQKLVSYGSMRTRRKSRFFRKQNFRENTMKCLLIYLYEIFLACKCQFIKQNVRDVLTSSYKGCVYMFTFGSICKCNTFIFLCIYTHIYIYKKSTFYYNTLNFGSDKHSSSFYQVKILKLRESVCE